MSGREELYIEFDSIIFCFWIETKPKSLIISNETIMNLLERYVGHTLTVSSKEFLMVRKILKLNNSEKVTQTFRIIYRTMLNGKPLQVLTVFAYVVWWYLCSIGDCEFNSWFFTNTVEIEPKFTARNKNILFKIGLC